MRSLGLTFLACSFILAAQTPEDPEIARARIDLNRIRALVESGVLPRVKLQKAEDAIADATDSVAIRKSIYSQDLTEDQANELVAAANRRFERRKKAYDDAKKLVDAGAMPSQTLDNLLQEMDFARKDCELAANRADLAQQVAAMAEAEAAAEARTPERTRRNSQDRRALRWRWHLHSRDVLPHRNRLPAAFRQNFASFSQRRNRRPSRAWASIIAAASTSRSVPISPKASGCANISKRGASPSSHSARLCQAKRPARIFILVRGARIWLRPMRAARPAPSSTA